MTTNPGALFSWLGRWIKSAAAPMPSPELAELRAATTSIRAAADHLTCAANSLHKNATDIGKVARAMRSAAVVKAPPAKVPAAKRKAVRP